MKKNTLIRIFSVVLCLLMVVACGKKETSDKSKETADSTAVWEGYKDMPFDKFLKDGLSAMLEDEYADSLEVLEVTVQSGWEKAASIDEATDLSEGCTACTYVITITDGKDSETDYFFMEQNADNVLICKGVAVFAGDYSEEVPATIAESALNDLIQYVKQ